MGCSAKIAVSKAVYAIDKPYDYRVPAQLEDRLRPGTRVLVPFGSGNRGAEGIVLSIAPGENPAAKKELLATLDDQPVLDEKGIKLALWMREQYFCTVYDAVKAMLPAGLYFALRSTVAIQAGVDREMAFEAAGSSQGAQKLVEMLFAWGGEAELEQVRTAFGPKDPNPAIRQLAQKGIVQVETSAQRSVGDKTERIATLAMPVEEAMALVTPRRRTAPLRYGVTELLCVVGQASTKELCYFTGASAATLRSLEKSGILTLERREVFRRVSLDDVPPAGPVELNEEQQQAFEALDALCQKGEAAAALLYGVTGSGKTQVYLRLIQETLGRGKTAMVLVPEIALTPQVMRFFVSYFGRSVAVLHSSLRAGERYDEWKRVRNGEARLVIGTRSAVFAPLNDLGLIILDEEHESSYKSENTPRYHARDVAKYRCVQHNALLLLGSATPSVESMYHAQQGRYHLVRLDHRYNQKALPAVEIVDMKEELRAGNGSCISTPLREELEQNLRAGEQSILFLNRRGNSRMVSCGACGEVPECPRCSVKLTYHSANGRLMCHYCGYSRPLPNACPSCGGGLNFIGVGTQRLQEELEDLFPGTEILRMDTDTISAAHPHQELLDKFRQENIPILVGTQMIAKGFNFPDVTLVGVVDADLALFVDSFRAGERTFSLITQVVGRAGRGGAKGRALIQTYTPRHEVIQFAARQDYDSFYRQEIDLRALRGFSPFQDVIRITALGGGEGAVLRCCTGLRQAMEEGLRQLGGDWQLLGPAPAAVAKVNDRYRYCMTVLSRNSRPLRELVAHLLRQAQQNKENRGVSVFADLNPLD
jgi:primosomal protein N' (replication factor Y)